MIPGLAPWDPNNWVAGCLPNIHQCTFYHFGTLPIPPPGNIAWCIIDVLSEQFRINQRPDSARWIVERWTYYINNHYVTDITNNFYQVAPSVAPATDAIDDPNGRNKTGSGGTCSQDKATNFAHPIMQLEYTDTVVPLRSILFLMSDLMIGFFFPIESRSPIAPVLKQGYKWQTRKDASTGAVITLEILDTTVPPGLGPENLRIDDLAWVILCELMREWVGDYIDEKAHQKSFVAEFSVYQQSFNFAKLTLEIPSRAETEGLEVLDENTWTGGSWLGPGMGNRTNVLPGTNMLDAVA